MCYPSRLGQVKNEKKKMEWWIFVVLGLAAFLLAGGFLLKKSLANTKQARKVWALVGIGLFAVGLFQGGFLDDIVGGISTKTISDGLTIGEAEDTSEGIQFTKELGASSTVTFNSYTGSWGGAATKAEVEPVYTIVDKDGQIINSDAAANTSSTYVGDVLDIYATGAAYYFDPIMDWGVDNQRPTLEIEVYTVPTTANMDIVVYDETGATALTADDNANKTSDYDGPALGAGETYPIYAKFETKVVDKNFRLGAICTYYCGGEIDDFSLEESGWTEVNIPNGYLTDNFYHYDDTNTSQACSYKRCYVPSSGGYLDLGEWEDVKYQFLIDTDDTTQPTENGDSYVGAVYLDYGCELNNIGSPTCDWYKHDANNDPGAIGLDENPESAGYNGLDVGFCVEPF